MSVIVVLLSALFPASAQNYTTDAILKRTTGKIATLECSGIARTKKEAIEMAKKSVIYTYLYNGIDGLNDNKPLLGSKPSAGAAQYVGQLLGTTRYANYIRSCTIADKTNKTVAKDIQVFATIDLYTESLERDLVNNGIIGRNAADIALSETQEMIAMPTVMVCLSARAASPTKRPSATIRICAWPFRRSTKVSSSRAWRPKTC